MRIKRKEFIQLSTLASASLMMPKFLKAFESPVRVAPGNKVLVVIQLSGGNDGLNTVIPVRNDIYYRERPKLGIKKEDAVLLNDEVGLNPSLIDLKTLFDDGSLGILNGVGYPNPDRSHFRSMDIWQSASKSDQYISTGWVGRYLDAQCKGCDKPTQALEIDDVLSLAMKGELENGLAFKDAGKLFGTSNQKYFREINAAHQKTEENIDYLYKTMNNTLSSADYIFQQSKLHPTAETYPSTNLGKDLRMISTLIQSDINTKVYYASLGSFDTHVNQEAQQKRLFTELNDALKALTADLKKNNRFQDVLIMTFSEFGRRVTQNASGGTDHGKANNMFLISGGLKEKGILNPVPDLVHLDDGDVQHQVDFKSVYATVLNKWLGADDAGILGDRYPMLNFI